MPENSRQENIKCAIGVVFVLGKFKALENKVNFTAMYNMTLTEMDSGVEYEIKDKVNSKVAGTGCLSTGNCTLAGIHVYLSEKVDAKYIMFTTEINCYVTGGNKN